MAALPAPDLDLLGVLDDLAGGASVHEVTDRIGRALEERLGAAVVIARRMDDGALRLAAAPSAPPDEIRRRLAELAAGDGPGEDGAAPRDPRPAAAALRFAGGVLALVAPGALGPDAVAALHGALRPLAAAWRRADEDAARAPAVAGPPAVEQLAGRVAHDVNNIVTVIATSRELLAEAIAADDPARGDLDLLAEATERARGLSRQLLAIAQRQPWQSTDVDVATALDGARAALAAELGPRVELVVDVAPGTPPVAGDAAQLVEALVTVALHLRRPVAVGGRAELRARPTATGVELLVGMHPATPPARPSPAPAMSVALLAARAVVERAGGALIDHPLPGGALAMTARLPAARTGAARRGGVVLVAPAEEPALARLLEALDVAVEVVAPGAALPRRAGRALVTVPRLFAEVTAAAGGAPVACFLDDEDDALDARAVLRADAPRASRRAPAARLATWLRGLAAAHA